MLVKKVIARAMAVVLIAAGGLTISAGTAMAHDKTYYWSIGCGVAGVQDCGEARIYKNHRKVASCDMTRDGIVFEVRWTRSDGVNGKNRDSSDPGCDVQTAPAGTYITYFQPCLDMGSYYKCVDRIRA
ncbi:hypothetical protein [Streptomyces smyrnaeus]|uniref:Secreted protein n=1 Tax=Streptomyces smyrnaeus TaxID=1387713 RepID=A0ABS3Y679_9ACTN|nr:hypothetical protein [Streptomyces smyrnaeus]MBO8203173.1 hypothetical protein [Streptomyces smyrnaeus]